MNARNYRVDVSLSPLDFPAIIGLGESSVFTRSEQPLLNGEKVALTITKTYILTDMGNNKEHAIFSAKSVYEIPSNEIKSREDVHTVFNDATRTLNEAYQYARTQLPLLINIKFPDQPIENYQNEIDRIFELLNSRN